MQYRRAKSPGSSYFFTVVTQVATVDQFFIMTQQYQKVYFFVVTHNRRLLCERKY